MKTNHFSKFLFVALLACGAYLYLDPGKPKGDDIKPLVLKALNIPSGAQVTDVAVGRSFQRHRTPDSPAVRTWPVYATVNVGSSTLATRHFYFWRDSEGAWTAEVDSLLVPPWDRPTQTGLGNFVPKL
jgi:hypothetical protein